MFGQDSGGQKGGGGFMPFFSPWYFVGRMLGGGPTEKVDHNPVTQILIPALRALMGGAGICIIIVGYISASYVWHANVALTDLGRMALPALVFGLPAIIGAAIGLLNPSPERYWGSRQSMFFLFGLGSAGLCWAFGGLALKDPQGILFWEVVKTSCFIGLAVVGFLLAIWGIVEQLIVYQMTESQKVGWSVIKGRLDEKIPTGIAQEVEGEPVIQEWRISVTMIPKNENGTNGRPIGPKLLHFDPDIVRDDEVAFWAASVLKGAALSYAEWVDKGKFGRRQYDHIWEVLAEKRYAAKRGSARNARWYLTDEGKRVLALWLTAFDGWDRGETDTGDLELSDEQFDYEGEWELDEYDAP